MNVPAFSNICSPPHSLPKSFNAFLSTRSVCLNPGLAWYLTTLFRCLFLFFLNSFLIFVDLFVLSYTAVSPVRRASLYQSSVALPIHPVCFSSVSWTVGMSEPDLSTVPVESLRRCRTLSPAVPGILLLLCIESTSWAPCDRTFMSFLKLSGSVIVFLIFGLYLRYANNLVNLKYMPIKIAVAVPSLLQCICGWTSDQYPFFGKDVWLTAASLCYTRNCIEYAHDSVLFSCI